MPATGQSNAANAAIDWSPILRATWEGYQRHYIFCGADCGGNSGLVYDPASEYQATSEGAAYGLLMAVMLNDQPTFNVIYQTAQRLLLNPATGLFHWRVARDGRITGHGSATDAEQDIAAALLFAQQRVRQGEWGEFAVQPYELRAFELIDAIWQYEVVDGRYVRPGDTFGDGQAIINLSYFAPAWYRLFDKAQGTTRWQAVIDQGYDSLFATAGAALGLAPDWSTASGQPAYDYCNRNDRPLESCGYDMRYEAIRVPWRIGLDCLWFGEPRACDWSRRAADFLNRQSPDTFARMYDLQGTPVVDYQDEAMLGMWSVAALAADDADLRDRLETLLYERAKNALATRHWGDTPNFYYNQSLAWFGAALLAGDFRNLLAEHFA